MASKDNNDDNKIEKIPKELKYKSGKAALLTGITGQVKIFQ
jgi:hypothetical protein